jgi:hypothetical protein
LFRIHGHAADNTGEACLRRHNQGEHSRPMARDRRAGALVTVLIRLYAQRVAARRAGGLPVEFGVDPFGGS